jgi:hypothetical protein
MTQCIMDTESEQWNHITTPLLNDTNTQPIDPYSSLISLHGQHPRHQNQNPSIDTRRSRQLSEFQRARKIDEIMFSLYTLIMLDVVAPLVILLLNCHPKIEYFGALLFILSLSHAGYIFGITKDSMISSQESLQMTFHQINRLIVNSLMLILLISLFSKLTSNLQILYWSLSLLLLLENCSVMNELFCQEMITPLLTCRCFLNAVKVLIAIAILSDNFRSHLWLGLWIIIAFLLIVSSLIIPHLHSWIYLPHQTTAAAITAHCLIMTAIFYLDYSLLLFCGRCE